MFVLLGHDIFIVFFYLFLTLSPHSLLVCSVFFYSFIICILLFDYIHYHCIKPLCPGIAFKHNLKRTLFWDVTRCSPAEVRRRFGGIYCLHLQGRGVSRASIQQEAKAIKVLGFNTALIIDITLC
jgi:hypothetical protein